jgi:general stress protein YciG
VAKVRIPDEVMEYFRKTGAMGGKARAKNHSPEELSAWGKKGGRPKGSGKKQAAKRQAKKGGR